MQAVGVRVDSRRKPSLGSPEQRKVKLRLEPAPRNGDLGSSGCVGAACSELGILAPTDHRFRLSCLPPVLSLCCMTLQFSGDKKDNTGLPVTHTSHPGGELSREAHEVWKSPRSRVNLLQGRRPRGRGWGGISSIHSFISQTKHLTTSVSSQVLTLRSREMVLKPHGPRTMVSAGVHATQDETERAGRGGANPPETRGLSLPCTEVTWRGRKVYLPN